MKKSNAPEFNAAFMLGSWRVQPDSNIIVQGSEEKHLENRLMQTLVYLARHQGEVISRERFFDEVWEGLVVNEEALSRAISLLRSALQDSAQKPKYIQTIPGVGYRLIAEVENIEPPKASQANGAPESQTSDPLIEQGAATMGPGAAKQGNNRYRIIAAAIVLLVTFIALQKFVWSPGQETSTRDLTGMNDSSESTAEAFIENSVAVLPFVNMSSDPEQEFFADGMTEELLNMLASIPRLRVPARTSSFFFKGKNIPVSQIAETLNVKHILEGSVRRSGNKIRITAQLVEAQSDRHVWSKTYDREMEDVFTIQDEVAAAIAEALVGSIESLKENPVVRTDNPIAYEAYRTGRLRWWRRNPAELHQAIELFTQATEQDPGFAPAYAAIADSWMLLVTYGDVHIVDGEDRAEEMISKALELDPESAEAYAALGLSRLIAGRKEEAEFALRKALELDDSYIPGYLWMSSLLSDLGRIPEEAVILLKAMAKDPLNELLAINYADNLQTRGDNEGAIKALQSVLRLQPDNVNLLVALSGVRLKSGDLAGAWTAARQAYEDDPGNVMVINAMATAWLELGDFVEAEEVWLEGIRRNRKSIELKVQYLTLLIIDRRIEDSENLMFRLFGSDVESLAEGYQRTYHYFMGLLDAIKEDFPSTRDHFERVIDPVVDQLYDRNQIFVLTTASLINFHMGELAKAEEQLLTAERVVGHARVDGVDNAEIYYSHTALFAMRGETEKALQTLQQAYDKGLRQHWLLEQDGRLDSLRDEPGFVDVRNQLAIDIEQALVETGH